MVKNNEKKRTKIDNATVSNISRVSSEVKAVLDFWTEEEMQKAKPLPIDRSPKQKD